MSARFRRPALTALLCASLLAPAPAGAQDGGMAFPSVGGGRWEGLVNFFGFITVESEQADGSFTISIRDVIDDTAISLDLVVDDGGQVTSGTMKVDITWFDEIVGTAPVTLEPFRTVHDQHQTGTLEITGSADRLVASGVLTHTVNTVSEGATVEEVSGTEAQAVEWVFRAIEATCVRVTLELIAASGISLMGSVLVPSAAEGSQKFFNELVGSILVWPTDVEDPEAIKEALEELAVLAAEIHLRQLPQAKLLLELVGAWSDLNAELAGLDECQTTFVDSKGPSKSWLVNILQSALRKALDSEDDYSAQELIDLLDAGIHEQAIDGELTVLFIDALRAKLDEAIADNDIGTIIDILAVASVYGWSSLHAKAAGAL